MHGKYKELIEACKKGNMYDFIASEGWRFDKSELFDILKQTLFAVYQRLGDQNNEVERLVPENLNEYGFFGDTTADENAYIEYVSGYRSYEEYVTTCEFEEVEPEPRD